MEKETDSHIRRRSCMKKTWFLLAAFLFAAVLTGCGKKDDDLEQYKSEMTEFTNTIDDLVSAIENIDLESETRTQELLGYLDEMDAAFVAMGNLEVPEQFANIEELADDASANLSKSVSLYHQAFDNPEDYDPQLVDAALEYYSRAFKRLDYIGTILQGDLPEDESITIIHESDEETPDEAPEQDQEETPDEEAPESGEDDTGAEESEESAE